MGGGGRVLAHSGQSHLAPSSSLLIRALPLLSLSYPSRPSLSVPLPLTSSPGHDTRTTAAVVVVEREKEIERERERQGE